ncbi:MAG: metallophosphoesterase family protein [Gammaproteobacteria bacterium]
MSNIELIGSINGENLYNTDYIAEILNSGKINLATGAAFVGRPETNIYANDNDVVKIRAELNLSGDKIYKWARKVLEDERQISIHHPHKTWFVFDPPDKEGFLVGSICPRLKPLHVELKPSPASEEQRCYYLSLLESVFRMYFLLAKTKNLKLDEGLSNFAADNDGAVYYLDDEYYTWDNFVSFSVMLGVFIRTFEWLDKEFILLLSDILVGLIDEIFVDLHCRSIVATQLQSLFMPGAAKQQLVREIIKQLARKPGQKQPKKTAQKRISSNARYFAVMADIHSNEAALDSVLKFYREHNIDQGLVLGDIVGYGPDPGACIEKIQETPFVIIKGNHDHAVATGNTEKGFSNNAKAVVEWTISQLDQAQRDWLNYLPPYINDKEWLAVHGAPMDPSFFYGYVYLMTAEDHLNYLQEKKIPLCFHGHSHMPGVFARDKINRDHHNVSEEVVLYEYNNALVCPGSVGQPRNGKPEAQCAVYDRKDKKIKFVTVEYPVETVVSKMKQYNLPEQLWHRLQIGK